MGIRGISCNLLILCRDRDEYAYKVHTIYNRGEYYTISRTGERSPWGGVVK